MVAPWLQGRQGMLSHPGYAGVYGREYVEYTERVEHGEFTEDLEYGGLGDTLKGAWDTTKESFQTGTKELKAQLQLASDKREAAQLKPQVITPGGECWNSSALAWVPLRGCQWLAGAGEAKRQAGNAAEWLIPGIKDNLDDPKALLALVSKAALPWQSLEVVLGAATWSTAQALKVLDQVQKKAIEAQTAQREYNASLMKLSPAKRESADRAWRVTYAKELNGFTTGVANLSALGGELGGDLQRALERTRTELQSIRFGEPITIATAAVVVTVGIVILAILGYLITKMIVGAQENRQAACLEQLPPGLSAEAKAAFLQKCMTALATGSDPYSTAMIVGGVAAGIAGLGYLASKVYVAK